MNRKKVFYFLFLWGLFLLPLVNFAVAQPSYVGINEGESYEWNTSFHKGPYEDYLVDFGFSEAYAENLTDFIFDSLGIDTDIDGWRVYITEIQSKKEYNYAGGEYDGVNYIYNFYERKEGGDWEREEYNKRAVIMEYDLYLYLLNIDFEEGKGFFPPGITPFDMKLWFTPTDTNWRRIASNIDYLYQQYYYGDGEADTEYCTYFFIQEDCGMSTSMNSEYNSQMKEFGSVVRYTHEGVLLHYEWTYDGHIIMEIDLEGSFLRENSWWLIPLIVIIIVLVIIPVTIVSIVMVRKKHRAKKGKIAPPKKEKKPEVPSPAAVTPAAVTPAAVRPPVETQEEVFFCPMCGHQVKAGKNFCQECGANLKE